LYLGLLLPDFPRHRTPCSIFNLALQFEPCPESVLEYDYSSPGSRTNSWNRWNHPATRPERDLLYKWFSDLDRGSSTSWASLHSNPASFQRLEVPLPMPMPAVKKRKSQTSLRPAPTQIRSARSMEHFRTKDSGSWSGSSRPNSLENSYDQLLHSSTGDALTLMCKRETSGYIPPPSIDESVEALPQCDELDSPTISAGSSRSSNTVLVYPRLDVETERTSGEMHETWKGRLSGLRKKRSQILRRG
jgi:hypothetical protein